MFKLDTTAQKKNFEKKRYLKQCRAINFHGIFQISKITETLKNENEEKKTRIIIEKSVFQMTQEK